MSTPTTHAHGVRAVLVGISAAATTVGAHAAAAGTVPHGAALIAALLVCATSGAAAGSLTVSGRYAGVIVPALALGAAQLLSHLVLTVAGGHHGDMGLTPSMIAAHAVAAVLLGFAIAAVEHLYRVCASVLCWLRLFATAHAPAPAHRARRRTDNVVAQSVLLAPGLGMRAPPRGAVANV
ncbi:hypothetical protein QWI29_13320 [Mycolicibacterium neoaurum]|uniref:hypothetical protein n=1 Tax=Mycolicibacterium neoaurum TaxID=1795 RepID=UPI00267240E4|nr:hypothetical protein [Mycolicibacterium neoaurum]MDO3401014.1 hypothetical protein [Mycolicibacterium neoaurum]